MLNGWVKRALLTIALLLASCTQPATVAPTTTTSLLGAPSTSASTTSSTFAVSGCAEAGADFELLCEAVGLIGANYVDPIGVDSLATAATRGVEEFSTDTDAAPISACTVPDPAFEPVCAAITSAEATPLDGVAAALTGIATYALDSNSAYLDPEALAAAQLEQSGEVEGIGALVTTEDRTADDPESTTCSVISDTCRMVVVSLLPDSPALRAGVLPEDEIVAVDGESVLGWTFDEVTSRVRGPAGTAVTVGFFRGQAVVELTITRAALTVPVIESSLLDGGVGYLRLNLFTSNSDAQVEEALNSLRRSGMTRLVFDLRDNPGGSLFAAINIASEFLTEGLVLRTQAPTGDTPYAVAPGGVATDIPMVVVVNRGSASASEVMSAALKEAGRAVVVGTRTFGKNTVQQRFPLSNGGALKLTIARWVTPGGTDFGNTGVTPDAPGDFTPGMTIQEVAELALDLAGG